MKTIRAKGPLALDRYMTLCLEHPQHGYYMNRDPLGAAGDFITAPEVTQIFGEMIGIWCAHAYDLMGRPEAFDVIELGPGRGTLMADVLRSAKVMPGFVTAARVRLIEIGPALRERQRKTLEFWRGELSWHDALDDIAGGPGIVLANEFFDALPVKQFRRTREGWRERCVKLSGNGLALGWRPSFAPLPEDGNFQEGAIVEVRPAAGKLAREISRRLSSHPGAALIVDYGHMRSASGDTLQAVRGHRTVSVLDRPGESDLTAHVDFDMLGCALKSEAARVWGPLTQRQFLLAMGLELRAQALKRDANGALATGIDEAVARIAGPAQMGDLFKVIATTSRGLPHPYPFATQVR